MPLDTNTITGNPTHIRLATTQVRYALRWARYDADRDGWPTSPEQRDACLAAIQAQADAHKAAGTDPATGQTPPTPSALSVGSASISYDQTARAISDVATNGLTPLARAALDLAGLAPSNTVRALP